MAINLYGKATVVNVKNEPLIIFVNLLFEQKSKHPVMTVDMEKRAVEDSIHANVLL